MKKILVMLLAFLPLMAMAQTTTIKPVLKAGDVHKYTGETLMSMSSPIGGANMKETKMSFTSDLITKSVTADSAVMENVVRSVDTPQQLTMESMGMTAGMNMDFMQTMVDKPTRFSIDKDGTLRNILNIKEVQAWTKEMISEVDKDNKLNPDMDMLCNATTLRESLRKNGIYSLYGRTIKSGDTESVTMQGLKVLRTYTVSPDGKTIEASLKSDMTSEDVKNMIIYGLKSANPDVVNDEQMNQIDMMWSMISAQGMDKIDFTGKETYVFGDDGWMTSYTCHFNGKIMGMTMDVSNSATLSK